MVDGGVRIDPDLTIDEILDRWPATASVFVRRRMHCVGCDISCFETVAEACRNYRLPLDAVLAELRAAAAEGNERGEPAPPVIV